jgi:hypothetical protein
MLQTAIHEDLKQGIKMVVHSTEGLGKSTFIGSLNNTLYCAAENGYLNLDKSRNTIVPISDYPSILALFSEVAELIGAGTNSFENIVIDSLTSIERMMTSYVVSLDPKMANNKGANINKAFDAYGNGVAVLNREWSSFLQWLDYFSSVGINVLCAAHSALTTVKAGEYSVEHDFIDVLLAAPKDQGKQGARHYVNQFADAIGYIYITKKDDNGVTKRILSVTPNDEFKAKNRLDVYEDIELPRHNGWNAFAEVVFRCKNEKPQYDYRTN